MTWVRFDDNFYRHPKVVGLSNEAFRLHVTVMCDANHFLTDGVVSISTADQLAANAIRSLYVSTSACREKFHREPVDPIADLPCPNDVIAELLNAGIWHARKDGSYEIHDFAKYQRSRAEVEDERAAQTAARSRGGLQRMAGAERDDRGRLLPAAGTPAGDRSAKNPNEYPAHPGGAPAGAPAAVQPHTHTPKRGSSLLPPEEAISEDISSTDVDGVASSFESFWRSYPRRVGKQAALRAWKKLSPAKRAAALSGEPAFVAAYEAADPDRRRFCPHPATWLSQGRWDDDPSATALCAPADPPKRVIHERAEDVARRERAERENREAEESRRRSEEVIARKRAERAERAGVQLSAAPKAEH